jgi:predicted AlkP superfamily pyrophosphatase or phosphodiesterase
MNAKILRIKQTILAMLMAVPLLSIAQNDTVQHVNSESRNAPEQQKKPYVIMISADGFRYDYAKKYQAAHLLALSGEGVQADAMIPSFPSLTFPNHYTLATGLYPAHHGLVNNSFYDEKRSDKYTMSSRSKVTDSSWYGGTPLWVLAEKQQMIAATMFWVGSEAAIQGVRPTYYYNYTEKISPQRKVQIVKDWLTLPEYRRPHLINLYLSEPDHSGHTYGPDAPETEKAVKLVDSTIFLLTEAVKASGLPVNFIFVSDHGMTNVDTAHPMTLPAAVDPAKFIIPASGTMVDLHAKSKADIKPVYRQLKKSADGYKVYLKSKMPGRYHYSSKDDRMGHIGDILLIPEWPKVFSQRTPDPGQHGFDPLKVTDMRATFFAWGPAIRNKMKIPAFENVNVYPLITEILGLEYSFQIDGKKEVLHKILK